MAREELREAGRRNTPLGGFPQLTQESHHGLLMIIYMSYHILQSARNELTGMPATGWVISIIVMFGGGWELE